MTEIQQLHDKFFKKVFSDIENTRTFLKRVLPAVISNGIDFEKLEVDLTDFVSDHFKESFTDVTARSVFRTGEEDENGEPVTTEIDIYFLFEHKSYYDSYTLVQLLMYMAIMWQKDAIEKKPLRLIVPLVFYHGREKWELPETFAGQFNVDDEIKEYLPDFRYVLFDTRPWSLKDETNEAFKDNVFLMTALALMKSAFNRDYESILEIFRFWHDKGFTDNREMMLFFLFYIGQTKDMDKDQLTKLLEESKIDGGDIMPTLAQRFRDEGKEIGVKETTLQMRRETVRWMMKNNFPLEAIADCLSIKKEEVKKLMH